MKTRTFGIDLRKAIAHAAVVGNISMVEDLLSYGVTVDESFAGHTPLWYAAQNGHIEIVKLLINHGANVNSVSLGTSVLAVATAKKFAEIVKILLAAKVTVDALDDHFVPLSLAAANGDIHCAKLLIEAGANVNLVTKKNTLTPLMEAIKYKHVSMTSLLLKNGAHVNYCTTFFETPLYLAEMHLPNLKQLLLEFGAKSHSITQHKYIDDTIIRFPEIGCLYHLKNSLLASGETTVSFMGSGIKNYLFFDVATGIFADGYSAQDDSYSTAQVGVNGTLMITSHSLPRDSDMHEYNIMMLDNERYPGELISVSSITYMLNTHNWACDYSGETIENITLAASNEALAKRFQKIDITISLSVGKYPIFLNKNKPGKENLIDLYKQFIQYNTKNKLIEQCGYTYDHCHFRAHFVTAMLQAYGIQTLKIYKMWDQNAWLTFPKYDLSLMSHKLKEKVIEFKCEEQGLSYRVIGLDNKEKNDLILWDALPDFPREENQILANKSKLLPRLLEQASKKDHTFYEWKFHCATMILDKDNQGWVWDPWEENNTELLNINEWLHYPTHPKPIKWSIANQHVISDYQKGWKQEGVNFMKLSTYGEIKLFQAMFSLALPNPPVKSLCHSVNQQSFFKARLKKNANKRKTNDYDKELMDDKTIRYR